MKIKAALITLLALLLASPAMSQVIPASPKGGGAVTGASPKTGLGPTPGAGPKVPEPHPVTSTKDLIKAYEESRDQSLVKLKTLVIKPPENTNAAISELNTVLEAPKSQLVEVSRSFQTKQTHKGEAAKKLTEYINTETKAIEDIYKFADKALRLQLEMAKKRRALTKAIGDTEELTKVIVQELKDASAKIDDLLKFEGKTNAKSQIKINKKFVVTVGGNVQHVWGQQIKAGQDVLEKDKNKPDSYKKRITEMINTAVHQAGHTENLKVYGLTEAEIALSLKKNQALYDEIYQKIMKVRKPLVTGAVLDAVPAFKGTKPLQVKARAAELVDIAENRMPK